VALRREQRIDIGSVPAVLRVAKLVLMASSAIQQRISYFRYHKAQAVLEFQQLIREKEKKKRKEKNLKRPL
jgi:hypothetical protein